MTGPRGRLPGRRGADGRRTRGQTLVEFALVLPIFLVILMSLLDFGRVIYAQHTINQDAREAARVGAVSADTLTSTLPVGCVANPANPPACDTRFTTRYAKIRAAAKVMAPAVPMTDASIFGGDKCDADRLQNCSLPVTNARYLPCSGVKVYTGGTPAMPDDAVTPASVPATTVTQTCFYPNGVINTNILYPPKVVVKISVTVPLITPIISSILGGGITISAESEQLLQ